jgi:hypothetical protein
MLVRLRRELEAEASLLVELPGIRPALISGDLGETLEEFLRFRHLFRNVYGFVLDESRMRPLEERFAETLDRFLDELRQFLDWMTAP